jgi:hypothetical protein
VLDLHEGVIEGVLGSFCSRYCALSFVCCGKMLSFSTFVFYALGNGKIDRGPVDESCYQVRICLQQLHTHTL